MKIFRMCLIFFLLIACIDFVEPNQRINPLDSSSPISLSISLLKNNISVESGENFKVETNGVIGSDGKNYLNLVKEFHWHIGDSTYVTMEEELVTSLDKIGNYTITVFALLLNDDFIYDESNLTIKPITSILEINSPSNNISSTFSEQINFGFSITDTLGNALDRFNLIEWTSDINGFLSSEKTFSYDSLFAGQHEIKLRVILSDGIEKTDYLTIIINPMNVNLQLLSPVNGNSYHSDQELNFSFEVTYNAALQIPLTVSWNSSLNGIISDQFNFNLINVLEPGLHEIDINYLLVDRFPRTYSFSFLTKFPGSFISNIILGNPKTIRIDNYVFLANGNSLFEIDDNQNITREISIASDPSTLAKVENNYYAIQYTASNFQGSYAPVLKIFNSSFNLVNTIQAHDGNSSSITGQYYDRIKSVLKANDSEYYILSYYYASLGATSTNHDSHLVKRSLSGTILFDINLDDPNVGTTRTSDLVKGPDNNLYLYYTNNSGQFRKIDSLGNTISLVQMASISKPSLKLYQSNLRLFGLSGSSFVIRDYDLNFTEIGSISNDFTGSFYILSEKTDYYDVYNNETFLRLNKNLTTVFKISDYGFFPNDYIVYNSTTYLVGDTPSNQATKLMALNSNGEIIWEKTLESQKYQSLRSVKIVGNEIHTYGIRPESTNNLWLVRFDMNGNILEYN